jgi:hypothetical protein
VNKVTDFLKGPFSNALGLVLIALVVFGLFAGGSVGAPAELTPLALTGGTSNITGNLAVSGSGTLGTGLTVTSGGATVTAGGLTVTAGTVSLPTSAPDGGGRLLTSRAPCPCRSWSGWNAPPTPAR